MRKCAARLREHVYGIFSVRACVRTCVRLAPSVSRCCAGCADGQAVGRPSDGPPFLIDRGITETGGGGENRGGGGGALSAADRPPDRPTEWEKNGTTRAKFPAVRQIWAREELERLSNMWKSERAPFDFCRPDAARLSRQIPSDFNSRGGPRAAAADGTQMRTGGAGCFFFSFVFFLSFLTMILTPRSRESGENAI